MVANNGARLQVPLCHLHNINCAREYVWVNGCLALHYALPVQCQMHSLKQHSSRCFGV